ncbi:hypothetical protein RJ639_023816 [Escallonia herrerae]|uniref:Reverse transcriptase Ty1/copia-type domain-containing protein n=1 Tax=Escallonia herrerae TaxID=1293975 RepID=A0AA88V284_9ASTE|nr:hypothetical protein RJ639_023816 [Escallonia herrerae]
MLIFGSDIDRVNEAKNFLASNFSMKDLGEADVILGIKIIRSRHGIILTQSSYIEKILGRFNHYDDDPALPPIDLSVKLVWNNGQAINQLEYSQARDLILPDCSERLDTFYTEKLHDANFSQLPPVIAIWSKGNVCGIVGDDPRSKKVWSLSKDEIMRLHDLFGNFWRRNNDCGNFAQTKASVMSNSSCLIPLGSLQSKWYKSFASDSSTMASPNDVPGQILLPEPNGIERLFMGSHKGKFAFSAQFFLELHDLSIDVLVPLHIPLGEMGDPFLDKVI